VFASHALLLLEQASGCIDEGEESNNYWKHNLILFRIVMYVLSQISLRKSRKKCIFIIIFLCPQTFLSSVAVPVGLVGRQA
jgi:hypothetical protein